jgi:hypothetical protein
MKFKKYILLFLFIPFCITDCKKYPDDDKRYFFRTAKRRILYGARVGYWELESFFVNGADSTGMYCHSTTFGLSCVGYQFGDKMSGYSSAYFISSYGPGTDDGKWSFTNSKKNIVIENRYGGGAKPLFIALGSQEWEIQKLEGKEFWLKTNYNNKEYYLKLKNPN